jgi:hypothetical protein
VSDISIKMSVSLSDGSFDSAISVPLDHKDQFEQMAAAWIGMMRTLLAAVRDRPARDTSRETGEK